MTGYGNALNSNSEFPAPKSNEAAQTKDSVESTLTTEQFAKVELPAVPRSGREQLLDRQASKQQPPIIIVAGLSGAGKTTLIGFLADIGIESSERLLPRPRRDDDTPGDRTWVKESDVSPTGLPVDRDSAGSIIWSDHKYTGYIGFRGLPLVQRLVKSDDCQGVAVILGRGVEIAPAVESFQRLLPNQPVVVVRVDAPTAVIANRLLNRPGATASERESRLAKLEPMSREDLPQLEALSQAWGLASILNISEKELAGIGLTVGQVQPASRENLTLWVQKAIDEAKEGAATIARDIRSPRTIHYGNRYIPDSVLDVLENVLVPSFEAHGSCPGESRWLLKGGLAVALYLPESRPVSPDIDFAVKNTPSAEQFLGKVITSILADGAHFTPASPKPVYHDRKFYGEVWSPVFKQRVELDALSATRIQPDEGSFCYKFDLDSYLDFHRRTVRLPNGSSVDLCPPEQIIIEKLIAGRGVELNKFDLFDSAGLLATLPTQPSIFRRLFEMQGFDPVCDRAVEERLGRWSIMRTSSALELLGYDPKDPLVEMIVHRLPDLIVSSKPPQMPSPDRIMTLNELKRFCMAHRAITSLHRIVDSVDVPVTAGDEITSIAKRFGGDRVIEAATTLKLQLVHYLEFELGARDIFVRRDPAQSKVIEPIYFADLEEQRRRSALRFASGSEIQCPEN